MHAEFDWDAALAFDGWTYAPVMTDDADDTAVAA